ncbi:uncharacterized protein LOC127801672 isoform X2 [Diospyros lotus]|nr:uncharacterized protein LOC127801672 isoform X2 [Diospyros lotus]
MGWPSPTPSIRLALVFSLSFAAASYTTYSYASYSSSSSSFSFFRKLRSSKSNSLPSTPNPKATPSDLLSLLGTPKQASSSIDPDVAKQLTSCLRFLVPFSPSSPSPSRKSKIPIDCRTRSRTWSEENELIWWPPPPVMELARLAFDYGGDPDAIYRALDPSIIPIPDVEESKENRCELTRTPYGRRFIDEELNSYLKFLFEIIASRGPSVGLDVSLSRFDLFHGHLFLATGSGRLGILFHAKEYPTYDMEVFPYNMGYCQIGSNVLYDDSMNLQNILWLAPMPSNSTKGWSAPGVLVVLDAHQAGIIYRDLIPEYAK